MRNHLGRMLGALAGGVFGAHASLRGSAPRAATSPDHSNGRAALTAHMGRLINDPVYRAAHGERMRNPAYAARMDQLYERHGSRDTGYGQAPRMPATPPRGAPLVDHRTAVHQHYENIEMGRYPGSRHESDYAAVRYSEGRRQVAEHMANGMSMRSAISKVKRDNHGRFA